MPLLKVRVRYEQAVYGSFPFWDKGYAVLAQSPGCRPEWLADLRLVCQRYGEKPAGADAAGGLFAIRLPSGPWAVVGVGSPGADDRGRPGALAFHALLLSPESYRKAGSSPFGLAGAIRHDWGPETTTLPAGSWVVEARRPTPDDPRAARIVEALTRGRRVAIEADRPIGALADAVWTALPGRVRRQASVATWAFGNGNRFDLVALPRLEGIALDPSYLLDLDPTAPERPTEVAPAGRPPRIGRRRVALAIAALAGLALGLLVLFGTFGRPEAPAIRPILDRTWARIRSLGRPARPAPPPVAPPTDRVAPPSRSAYPDEPADPEERARVAEGLLDLAEQFGIVRAETDAPDSPLGPAALMARIADRLRYRGPWLAPEERARLVEARDRDPAAGQALAWHDQVRRFAPDRPLPADFESGPLRWQLDTLAWSFRLDPDPLRSPAEIPHRLGQSLAVEGPTRPNPLVARYPALAAYAAFLDRLPRR